MSADESTEADRPRSCRRVDWASLALLLTGLATAGFSCWLIIGHGASALIIAPSIIAAAIGGGHITKRQASRIER